MIRGRGGRCQSSLTTIPQSQLSVQVADMNQLSQSINATSNPSLSCRAHKSNCFTVYTVLVCAYMCVRESESHLKIALGHMDQLLFAQLLFSL